MPETFRGPFLNPATLARQGGQLLMANLDRRWRGLKRYPGSAAEICEQIVHDCYDPERQAYLTSRSSYNEFWARDFGRCVPALLQLGFSGRVRNTYRYALHQYEKGGGFSLVITSRGKLFDFPAYAPDGFAFFMFGLEMINDPSLIQNHRHFLERELHRFVDLVMDPESGLAKRHVHFSEAQDYALRKSSCYTNSMCFLLQRSCRKLGFSHPWLDVDLASLVERHFWQGNHYRNDLSGMDTPSGDAQVMPLWTGLTENVHLPVRDRLDSILDYMDRHDLNHPLPSRYGISGDGRQMILLHKINPWQKSTVWTCLGLQLIEVLKLYDHPRFFTELKKYEMLVQSTGCFPEIIDPSHGGPYSNLLVVSEDSMIWAATLWALLEGKNPLVEPHSETRAQNRSCQREN